MIDELMVFIAVVYAFFLAKSWEADDQDWALMGTIVFFVGMIILLLAKAEASGYIK